MYMRQRVPVPLLAGSVSASVRSLPLLHPIPTELQKMSQKQKDNLRSYRLPASHFQDRELNLKLLTGKTKKDFSIHFFIYIHIQIYL